MNDILFHHDKYIFSYRVSGILVCDGKVLFQAQKSTGEYAFIGGHVAFGETNAETLIREWREEVGADIEVGELKWVGENFFPWGDKSCHQISLSYLVHLRDAKQIPLDGSFVSREHHEDDINAIFFHWVPFSDVKNRPIYPAKAGELLLQLDEEVKHFVYRE